jgi:hypothetical protein
LLFGSGSHIRLDMPYPKPKPQLRHCTERHSAGEGPS